jgi:hypothetical protein
LYKSFARVREETRLSFEVEADEAVEAAFAAQPANALAGEPLGAGDAP